MGGTYYQAGDYLLPNLVLPESVPVGIWGQRRRRYLKTHREPIYTALLLSGELNSHLSEIDAQAETIFFQLVKQMAEQKGITEQLILKRWRGIATRYAKTSDAFIAAVHVRCIAIWAAIRA